MIARVWAIVAKEFIQIRRDPRTLAIVALVVLVLLYGVINPSLAGEQKLPVEHIETGLAGLIGFYFGART